MHKMHEIRQSRPCHLISRGILSAKAMLSRFFLYRVIQRNKSGRIMSYSRENELGRITISDRVFAVSIAEILSGDDLRHRVWLSGRRGRIINDADGISQNEAAQSVTVSTDDSDRAVISFCAVVRFGDSISLLARECADTIAAAVKKMSGSAPASVTMNVCGIKSKEIARRSMEVTFIYEADGSRIDD